MIKEALAYFKEQLEPNIIGVDGIQYSDKQLIQVKPKRRSINGLMLNSLTSFFDFTVNQAVNEFKDEKLFILVHNFREVSLYTGLVDESRDLIVSANCDKEYFSSDRYHDAENFIIDCLTHFEHTDTLKQLLSVVGNVKEEHVSNTSDDGVTQKVTVAKGLSMVESASLPKFLKLKMYTTFPEIEQPELTYFLRAKDGPAFGLWLVQNDEWKLDTAFDIANFLKSSENEDKKSLSDFGIDVYV